MEGIFKYDLIMKILLNSSWTVAGWPPEAGGRRSSHSLPWKAFRFPSALRFEPSWVMSCWRMTLVNYITGSRAAQKVSVRSSVMLKQFLVWKCLCDGRLTTAERSDPPKRWQSGLYSKRFKVLHAEAAEAFLSPVSRYSDDIFRVTLRRVQD